MYFKVTLNLHFVFQNKCFFAIEMYPTYSVAWFFKTLFWKSKYVPEQKFMLFYFPKSIIKLPNARQHISNEQRSVNDFLRGAFYDIAIGVYFL